LSCNLIIIGGGEHAQIIMEAVLLQPEKWNLIGYLDPKDRIDASTFIKTQRLGNDSDLPGLLHKYQDIKLICGFGDNIARRKKITSLNLPDDRWATVIHPSASVSPHAKVAAGSVVLNRVILQAGVKIGRHCIINAGSIIEYDTKIGDFSHIAPGVVMGGKTSIGTDCFIGLGSRIKDFIEIGNSVTVGTGSVVVTNILDGESVAGVPARRIADETNSNDIHEFCVSPDMSIYEAMSVIGKSGKTISVVVDSEMKVLGLLTDGDIRRAMLKNTDLNKPVSSVMNVNFRYVKQNLSRIAALDQMNALGVMHMPILNDDGKIVGVHLLSQMVGNMKLPNIAVIMAGGKGVRLKPITDNIPKPMVKVAGRPILEHIILHLASSNIREIYISTGYLGNLIEEYFKDGSTYGVNINYIREATPLGTGGALGLLPKLPDAPFIVMNGDLVTQFDVEQILHHHNQGDYKMTIGVHDYRVDIPYGVICWDEEQNMVHKIQEKPEQHFIVNGGIYIVDPSLLELIEPNQIFPMTSLIDKCLEKQIRVGVHMLEGDWMDIGHHKELATARGM
jgi:sugar O-acyltransferase (sialic acid O-acetyltransferase NeuD family)